MPELAVEVLGVHALHPLPAADALIERPAPRGEKGREAAEVRGRGAAGAEGDGQPRVAVLVHEAVVADRAQLVGQRVERLVPGDRRPARVLVLALAWVGPLHRTLHAVGVVELLHEAVGTHAGTAAGGMLGDAEVRLDLDGHAVLDDDVQEVGTGHALVAVGWDLARAGGGSHAGSSARIILTVTCVPISFPSSLPSVPARSWTVRGSKPGSCRA